MNIDRLMDDLNGITYVRYGEEYPSIFPGHKETIKNAVITWANREMSELEVKVATLEAKVEAYESIIKNSNFEAIITKEKRKGENHGDHRET